MPRDLLAPKQKQPRDLLADTQPQSKTEGVMRRIGYGNFGQEALGLGETALQVATGAVAQPIAGLAGIGAALVPGGESGADAVNRVSSNLTYSPRTEIGQRTSEAIAKPFNALDRVATYLGDPTENGNPMVAAGIKAALLTAPLLMGAGARGRSGAKPTPKPRARSSSSKSLAPSIDQLRARATAAYKAADDAGVVISKDAMKSIVDDIRNTVANEGLDSALHPDATAAMRRLLAAANKHHSLKGAEILRRVVKDAEASIKPADRRMAAIIREKLDARIEGLTSSDVLMGDAKAGSAALREARGLWSRTRKAEVIDELMHRAELSAPSFSASGMENAIRIEFKNLAKNQKRMRQFNAAERAAIERVAKGGPIENTLRMLGKFAPTGAVSGAISGGAGFAIGGPVGAIALPVAGGAARLGAKYLTTRNAARASELMRRGPPIAKASRGSRNPLASNGATVGMPTSNALSARGARNALKDDPTKRLPRP